MQLFGTYTTTRIKEDVVFCLWSVDEQTATPSSLPPQLIERFEDFGTVDQQQIWIQRARLAEAFLEINAWQSELSSELDFWRRLFHWSTSLAAEGRFQPGLVKSGDLFFSKWVTDWSAVSVMEQLEEWFQEGIRLVGDGQLVRSFTEDIVDSYVRFIINTKFSLKRSQLGKLLQFKAFYLHEDWIQRLCAEYDEPGVGKRWQELYEAYQDWRGDSEPQFESVGRFCLRLEPTLASTSWQLRFYWMEPSGNLLEWTRLSGYRPLYMNALAEVMERFPRLFQAASTLPIYCELNTEQAYRFFRETAPVLRREGHAVFVPQSMQRPPSIPYRLEVSLDANEQSGQTELGLESLVAFDFRLSLGDQVVDEAELTRWMEASLPLVEMNGEWIVLDQSGLKNSLEWLDQVKKKRHLSLRDAFHLYALNGDSDLLPISIQNLNTTGWINECFQWLEQGGQVEEYPIPVSFQGQLRPYQRVGMSWLIQLRKWNMGACLADDMGLGKTIQFLSYLAYCKEQGWLDHPFLLICPTSVLGNWQKEIQRFIPDLSVMVHHGPTRAAGDVFREQATKVDIVLTTYSLAQRDHASFSLLLWDGIVLDEAQHIKNSSTLQSKAIRGFNARHRITLTGTPMENRLEELWSIFEFLNPGFLGSKTNFRRQFAQPIEKLGDKERMTSLKRLVRPFLLRRSKSDPSVIRDLPEKIETKEYCPLTTEQAALYARLVNELLDKEKNIQGFARKGLILSSILRLKQICNHPALLDQGASGSRSGKLNRLIEMVTEMLDDQDHILIFTQFTKMGHLLQRKLQEEFKLTIPFLHGGVPAQQREGLIDQFQEKGSSPILILSLKAGGVGLNLTRANRVIHFDRWWNPAVENQATDRAFRIGQTRTVHVHKLICLGTIEEKIDRMIERKQDLVQDVIGSGENWITELGSDELRDLLTLHHQLIEDF
ncbi:hypothetical protein BEP19_16175 [Ammoniphilus oxalaticus]|uniref:ATP-dependent helicase n=1 Tax=Ammoniphilus oxalaticus TaxID=66863 RepID=A0A419SQQ8_9BACL|nr:DEAD/DEAH box helicase [Ammoniphilus oxalaticus]RKD26737.1 hypothetical protein BEP19_16175 [Ammoniphilus oxalaticus]